MNVGSGLLVQLLRINDISRAADFSKTRGDASIVLKTILWSVQDNAVPHVLLLISHCHYETSQVQRQVQYSIKKLPG